MNCMKCRKPKPMKAEVKKKLQGKINEYMVNSLLLGHEKAMQILEESNKNEVTEDE